jgi:hypothetical protein
VYGGEVDPMPLMEMFDCGVQLRMGQAHGRRWIDDLLPIVSDSSDALGVREFATHHLPQEDAPRGYDIFRDEADVCVKVVSSPTREPHNCGRAASSLLRPAPGLSFVSRAYQRSGAMSRR